MEPIRLKCNSNEIILMVKAWDNERTSSPPYDQNLHQVIQEMHSQMIVPKVWIISNEQLKVAIGTTIFQKKNLNHLEIEY